MTVNQSRREKRVKCLDTEKSVHGKQPNDELRSNARGKAKTTMKRCQTESDERVFLESGFATNSGW
jgi:hypothetical protein